jgi:hypothetical protein
MTADQYIAMCEQMGWEIDMKQLPKDPSELTYEAQAALLVLRSLPDNWDGMNGTWLGKDYAGLSAIMDIYEIDNRREVFELLQLAESELQTFYSEKQKQAQQMSRAKRA